MHGAAAASSHGGNDSTYNRSKRKANSKQPPDWEDLVEEEKEVKNWKGIFIAVMVIVTVISIVIGVIILVTPDAAIDTTGDKLTLDEYLDGTYTPFSIEPLWSPDGKSFLYKTKDNELLQYECEANISTVFLDNSSFEELNSDKFLISSDKNFILFPYQREMIYKHTTLTNHKLYDTNTRLYRELIGPKGQEFQYVTWTHTGQGLIVVQQNNVFFKKSFVDTVAPFIPITSNGEEDAIYNGVPDWLYGEEILQSDSALWLSPDDQYLLYVEFNDTNVEHMSTVRYGDPKNKYTQTKRQRYPKIGMANPTFRFKMYNFGSNTTKTITPPTSIGKVDYYFRSVTWLNDANVAIVWVNRSHNMSIVTVCSAASAYCYENLRIKSDNGWVDAPKQVLFMPTQNTYVIIVSRKDGENGYFKHIALVDSTVDIQRSNIAGKKIFITVGKMEVTDIVGYHKENQTIYFLAIPYDDPKQRHLYSTTVNKDHSEFRKHQCISCTIGDDCQYVDAKFGTSGNYYVLGCLGPSVPSYSVYETPDLLVTHMEGNSELRELIATKRMPVSEFVQIPMTENISIWGEMILPPVLKKDEIIRYDLILITNEHIGEQSVTYKFDISWGHFMSSFHSIIIASVDTRGTSGRGDSWSKSIYRNIGILDVDDVITSVRYFKSLHYVNEKMAVLGKGYGGYLATAALSSDINDVLKCGVAMSPITDFRYMNSYFAEKYHGTSDNNMNNYNDKPLSRYASNLLHRDYLILHGTTDDRIHFQHSAQYIKALVASNVYHQFQIYPDKSDILGDTEIKEHVHTFMENFLVKCFGLTSRTNPEVIVEVDEDEDE